MPNRKIDLERSLKRVIRKHEILRKRNIYLEANIEDMEKSLDNLAKKGQRLPINNSMMAKVQTTYVNTLFRRLKFLADDDDESKAMDEMYDLVYTKKEQESLSDQHKTLWKNTYGDALTRKMNKVRSYVQNCLKDALKKFYAVKKYLPTTEEIMSCALRTIDFKTERGSVIFELYWTQLLGTYYRRVAEMSALCLPLPVDSPICLSLSLHFPILSYICGERHDHWQ